ncbi:MAG: helix-turn-helix transcriptional regulator [Nitrospirota bacterium]
MPKTIHSEKYRKLVSKLKSARREAGFTQIQVAKRLKKTQSYISKVEAGEQRIDVIELKMFADLYKKVLNYFIK